MPEGDIVWRTAQRLHEVLAGRALTRSDLRWPELSTIDLTGWTTLAVVPRGKHLLHRVAGPEGAALTVHSHLRMEGSWQVEATRTPPAPLGSPHVRAVLATSAWTAIGDRLGMLDVVRTAQEETLVGHLGPDLLDPDWSDDHLAAAVANLAAADGPIGRALLDQTRVAGLGTIWMAESLFAQRINPWASASGLDEAALRRLVLRARALLSRSCHLPPGREPTRVHGRARRPCVRCGTPIAVAPIGPPTRERVAFHCPRCQAGPGPG